MTLKGKWRIVEMALWDLDFLDMMEPAYIFSTTKPGASSPSAASPAKSTAARPRLHLYRPTLADFFNSLLVHFQFIRLQPAPPPGHPIAYDPVGGRVGERAGADSTQVGNAPGPVEIHLEFKTAEQA